MNDMSPVTAPRPVLRWIGCTALRIDDALRRKMHVCEYSKDPHCVFRMQVAKACQDILLADGTRIRRGDKLINIHLWNEHVPVIPPEGPTFAWARRMGSNMDFSLRQLAAFVAANPELDSIVAVRAKTAVSTPRTTRQLLRIMQHYGFEIVPDDTGISWRRRLHEWGENVLALLMMMAVNPESAKISVLARVRSQVLLSRRLLDGRYGEAASAGISARNTGSCDRQQIAGESIRRPHQNPERVPSGA